MCLSRLFFPLKFSSFLYLFSFSLLVCSEMSRFVTTLTFLAWTLLLREEHRAGKSFPTWYILGNRKDVLFNILIPSFYLWGWLIIRHVLLQLLLKPADMQVLIHPWQGSPSF